MQECKNAVLPPCRRLLPPIWLRPTAIRLDRGRLVSAGPVRAIVAEYLAGASGTRYEATVRTGRPQFLRAELVDAVGAPTATPLNTDRFGFRLRYLLPARTTGVKLGIGVSSVDATTVFTTSSADFGMAAPADAGQYEATVMLPPDILLAGDYHLAICLWDQGQIHDLQEPALSFAVDVGPSILYSIGVQRKGLVNVHCDWELSNVLMSSRV